MTPKLSSKASTKGPGNEGINASSSLFAQDSRNDSSSSWTSLGTTVGNGANELIRYRSTSALRFVYIHGHLHTLYSFSKFLFLFIHAYSFNYLRSP